MQNKCEKLAIVAFAANAVLHAVVLLNAAPISLAHTWPAHLLAVGVFFAMMIRLVSDFGTQAQVLSRMDRESLEAYRDEVEREGMTKSIRARMFGATPGWVCVVVVLLAAYGFGSFLINGLERPWSIVMRDGDAWYFDDDDGNWIRRVAPEDAIADKRAELSAATSLCALFAFIPWAFFRYSNSHRGSEDPAAAHINDRPASCDL